MPSHSVQPSPLDPATAAIGAQHDAAGGPTLSEAAAKQQAATYAAGDVAAVQGDAAMHDGGEADGGDDMPTQVPEDSDSDATQPGDVADEPQQDEGKLTGDAGNAELVGARAAGPRKPRSGTVSPALTKDRDAGGGKAADSEPHREARSPFAAAKAAVWHARRRGAAANAGRPRIADPYDFPETQGAAGPPPEAGLQLPAAAAAVSAVPESDDAPTSREKTPPVAAAAEAGPAADPAASHGSADPLEHAESPDQQSQHVPKASTRRGAPPVTDRGGLQVRSPLHSRHFAVRKRRQNVDVSHMKRDGICCRPVLVRL